MTASSVLQTGQLLEQVFPGAHVGDEAYLRWLYVDSPFGPVVETNLDDADGRAGHYALVPIALSVDGAPRQGALSLNTAVHERARGGGVFVALADQTFAAARAQGIETVLGVANANSTPGFLRRLGFTLVGELPAAVIVPMPPGRGRRLNSAEFPDGGEELLQGSAHLLGPPERGLARDWTVSTLSWRLRSPGARYALHASEDVLAVSTLVRQSGIRIAVILKVFARAALSSKRTRDIVGSAALWHRAPLALHAGHSDVFSPRGIALPRRLRPSPLNLIRRELAAGDQRAEIMRFEFLDFDAY